MLLYIGATGVWSHTFLTIFVLVLCLLCLYYAYYAFTMPIYNHPLQPNLDPL